MEHDFIIDKIIIDLNIILDFKHYYRFFHRV